MSQMMPLYHILECDKSCDGCNGDGPDMCLRCADGYVFQDPVCIGNLFACIIKFILITQWFNNFEIATKFLSFEVTIN